MKYQPQNIALNEAEKQPVFSEKATAEIRLKLRQLAEIEFLIHTEKSLRKRRNEKIRR